MLSEANHTKKCKIRMMILSVIIILLFILIVYAVLT